MRVEQVMFRSGPVRCAGDLYLPEGVDVGAPVPGVVMGHSVVMVKEALGPHAEYLVKAGFVVLAVDWRTVGASEGEPRCGMRSEPTLPTRGLCGREHCSSQAGRRLAERKAAEFGFEIAHGVQMGRSSASNLSKA